MKDITRKSKSTLNLRDRFSPKFFSVKKSSPAPKKKPRSPKKIEKKRPNIKKARKKKNTIATVHWSAREFIKKDRSPNWYLYAGITAIGLVALAVITKSPVMAVTFILITGVVYLTADKEPDNVNVKLTPKGLLLDEKLYPYKELKSFWIFYDPPDRKILSIVPEKIFVPQFHIQLESQNPVLIRKYLIRYLTEEEQEESLIDNLAERFKI